MVSSDPHAGVCDSCHRLGCPCLGQENDSNDCSDACAVEQRIEHIERLAASLGRRRQRQSAQRKPLRLRPACPVNALTGAGEDRTSRCHSLSGYFYSVLPHPFVQGMMAKHGKAAYQGLREPLQLSKTSNQNLDGLAATVDVQTACLARRLIRLAVSLMYMDATSSEHVRDLQLSASAMETAQRYVEAAKHLTSNNELLLSPAGLECVMMEGHWSIHLGRIEEGGVSFRRALHLAQRIDLPQKAAADDEDGIAARLACMRLISANRSLSLYCGEPCADIDDNVFDRPIDHGDDPSGRLKRCHARIWKQLVARNVRIERAWGLDSPKDAVLNNELLETLHIDREMKQATLTIPSTWWQLPDVQADTEEGAEATFTSLNVSMDHFNTIVLTHLPYVLQASTTTSSTPFIYSKCAAIFASREVLLRFPLFQGFKHVPASYRALERKAFIAAVVLLLAHMHSHRVIGFDAIEHERPKDLNALFGTISAMDTIFSKDRHNPGSECARKLRRMMAIDEEMAYGLPHSITCSYDKPSALCNADSGDFLDIELPYFGNMHVERERLLEDFEVSEAGEVPQMMANLTENVSLDTDDCLSLPCADFLTDSDFTTCADNIGTFSPFIRSETARQESR